MSSPGAYGVRENGRFLGLVESASVDRTCNSQRSERKAHVFSDSWLDQLDVGALYIAPGSPWENGYSRSYLVTYWAELPASPTVEQERLWILLARWRDESQKRQDLLAIQDHRPLSCSDGTPSQEPSFPGRKSR